MKENKKELIDEFLKKVVKDEFILNIALKISNDLFLKEDYNSSRSFALIGYSIIYLSYIKSKNPKTLDEIHSFAYECADDLNDYGKYYFVRAKIGKTYREIKKVLELKNCKKEESSIFKNVCVAIRKPKDFISRIDVFNLSDKTKEDIIKILEQFETKNLGSGKNPMSILAGACYVSAIINEEKLTQGDIQDKLDIKTTTINTTKGLILSNIEFEKNKKDYFIQDKNGVWKRKIK